MSILPSWCVAGHGSDTMKQFSGLSTFFPNSAVLWPHTPKLCGIFHCDKYAFEEKNDFVLASQSLGAHRQKSHFSKILYNRMNIKVKANGA